MTTATALAVIPAAEYLDTRVLLAFVGAFMLRDAVRQMGYLHMLVEGGCVAPRAIPLRERTRAEVSKRGMGRREVWNYQAGQYQSPVRGGRE